MSRKQNVWLERETLASLALPVFQTDQGCHFERIGKEDICEVILRILTRGVFGIGILGLESHFHCLIVV